MEANYDSTIYLQPRIDPEDVNQQMALFELETGIAPSRRLIVAQLKRQAGREYLADDLPEDGASPFGAPAPSQAVIDQLLEWAAQKVSECPEAVEIIDWFMEEPADRLEQTIQLLTERELIPSPSDQKKGTFSRFILRVIESAGMDGVDRDSLYDLAREQLQSTRPEAAVRQVLRRLLKAGIIELNPATETYHTI